MDEQKQIEELVFDLIKATSPLGVKDLTEPFDYKKVATDLYKLWGWRKIPENTVVVTEEEYKKLIYWEGRFDEIVKSVYETTRKETAEKFAEKVSQAIVDNTYPYFDKDGKPVNIWNAVLDFDKIDEICKEFTER